MNLSMDILIEWLSKYEIEQVYGVKSLPTLESVRLLHRFLDEMDSKYLYMGIPEDIERIQCDTKGITIISSGIPKKYDHIEPNCNLYFIQNEVDFGQFYNEVEDVFTYYNTWSQKLNDLCSSMASLQSLIDIGDEVIPYPISLVDGAERTVAYSQHKKCDDAIWQYIREGYIKTEYLLRDNIRSKDIAMNRAPKQMYTVASNRYVMLQPVVVHQHTVAFVALIMEKAASETFSRATEHLLAELTRAITNRMEADEFYGASMGVAVEFFLADIISRKLTDRDVIRDRAQFFGQNIYESRRLFCIAASDGPDQDHRLRNIRETVSALLPSADSCSYQNNAVFIEHGKNLRQDFLQEHTELAEWIKRENLVCGISTVFRSLFEMADYYEQAQTAVRLGSVLNPDQLFYDYESYIMMHSIEMLDRQCSLRTMIHPIVWKIIELYGEEHHMINTLYVYLACERNISNAAKQLFVHRNTMLYRIEPLIDKLQNDFSDANLRRQLIYSLEIAKYLKYYKKESLLIPEEDTVG